MPVKIGIYRKKPVCIEAFQFTEDLARAAVLGSVTLPWGLTVLAEPAGYYVTIATLEGEMRAGVDDWIIRGIKGELYPCKPDVFAMTYEYMPETID